MNKHKNQGFNVRNGITQGNPGYDPKDYSGFSVRNGATIDPYKASEIKRSKQTKHQVL